MIRNRLILLVLLLLPSSLTAQARSIDWGGQQDLPFPSMSGEAVVCGGAIHVVGGRRVSGENGTYHYMYQTETNEWEKKASLQTGRANLAIACVDERIYALGGDPFLDSVEIYDPETDEWSYGAPMPTPRQHIDCGVVDGKIYVIGGLESWDPAISDKNEVYDPATDRWETKAPIPTPRHNPAIEVVEGKIYVLGGAGVGDSTWARHSVVEVYDPETDLWTEKQSLPEARFKPATAVVSNKIYVIGGWIGEDVVPNVDVFDPLKNTWSEADDLPKPVVFPGVVSIGNQIFVLGGSDAEFNPYVSNLSGSVAPDPIKVTYIANAGFLIESSTRKVLIDALFEEGWGQYLVPTPAIRTQIINGQPPFDGIDLILPTHDHGDHFEASLVGQHLQQNPTGFLVAPADAVSSMRGLPEYRGIEEQIYEASPARYGSEKVTLNGIDLEIVRLQHDTRPEIQNLGFILNIDGNTILHVGDNTGADRTEFESYLLNNRDIDIAFLNHYGHWSTEEERALSKESIDPRLVILTHIPPGDVDRIISEVKAIPPGFPPIRVFSQQMEEWYPLALSTQAAYSPPQHSVEDLPSPGPYLNQPLPGNTASLFAPGLVSVQGRFEYAVSLSPEGRELLFSTEIPGEGAHIVQFRVEGSEWVGPTQLSLSEGAKAEEMEAFFTPDGEGAYFAAYDEGMDVRIWAVDRTPTGWESPRPMGPPLSEIPSFFPTTDSDGTVYFTDLTTRRVARVKISGDSVGSVEDIGLAAMHPFIAPDGSFLLVNARGEEEGARADIFVAFRQADGSWSELHDLGPAVNTEFPETCPSLSPDGQVLFFSRYNEEGGVSNIYWVDASVIQAVREGGHAPQGQIRSRS